MRLFDQVDGPNGWDDRVGYGAAEVGKPAFVVVTSSPPESVRLSDLDWTFVTTGLSDAVTVARERAEAASSDSGNDLDVVLMGGGATIGSAFGAGLVDVLSLHLAPVVLGAGTPLFTGGPPRTLVQRSVTSTSTATHLTYDVLRRRRRGTSHLMISGVSLATMGEVRPRGRVQATRGLPGSDRAHVMGHNNPLPNGAAL